MAATAAAVAEAAWRDLDRVRDCCKTFERGPQPGATAFGVWQRRWQRLAAGQGSAEDPRTGRIGRSEARRRATSCCEDRHGSSMPTMFSTTDEELKHQGVGLNMVIMVMRGGHAAHIRLREMDVSMGVLGWQERGEDTDCWTRCGWRDYDVEKVETRRSGDHDPAHWYQR